MPTFRYVGAVAPVDVVGVGVLERGQEFDATGDQADRLAQQPDSFAPVKKKATKKAAEKKDA